MRSIHTGAIEGHLFPLNSLENEIWKCLGILWGVFVVFLWIFRTFFKSVNFSDLLDQIINCLAKCAGYFDWNAPRSCRQFVLYLPFRPRLHYTGLLFMPDCFSCWITIHSRLLFMPDYFLYRISKCTPVYNTVKMPHKAPPLYHF